MARGSAKTNAPKKGKKTAEQNAGSNGRAKERTGMDGQYGKIEQLMTDLREMEARVPAALVQEFNQRLEISWTYHECALEGVILSYSEINAAIDQNIISNASLIPSYHDIKHLKDAIDWVKENSANRKRPVNLDTIRTLYGILAPEELAKSCPYRKDNPLHRLYYHEIAAPDKIGYRMRKLSEWLEEDEAKQMHVLERAARAQFRLMAVFPWTRHTGKVARLLANFMLLREGYVPAIIHSIDRQRYYEALRSEDKGIVPLYQETMVTSIQTALKFYDEALATAARRRAAS